MSLLLALVSQSGSINLVASDLTVANTSTQGAIVVVKDTIASSVLQSSFSSSSAITVVIPIVADAVTTVNLSGTGALNTTHNLIGAGAQQAASVTASSITKEISLVASNANGINTADSESIGLQLNIVVSNVVGTGSSSTEAISKTLSIVATNSTINSSSVVVNILQTIVPLDVLSCTSQALSANAVVFKSTNLQASNASTIGYSSTGTIDRIISLVKENSTGTSNFNDIVNIIQTIVTLEILDCTSQAVSINAEALKTIDLQVTDATGVSTCTLGQIEIVLIMLADNVMQTANVTTVDPRAVILGIMNFIQIEDTPIPRGLRTRKTLESSTLMFNLSYYRLRKYNTVLNTWE